MQLALSKNGNKCRNKSFKNCKIKNDDITTFDKNLLSKFVFVNKSEIMAILLSGYLID